MIVVAVTLALFAGSIFGAMNIGSSLMPSMDSTQMTMTIKIHTDHLVRTRNKLNEILAKNTGKSIEEIARDTERDNFMYAEQAKEYGLIDEVMVHR